MSSTVPPIPEGGVVVTGSVTPTATLILLTMLSRWSNCTPLKTVNTLAGPRATTALDAPWKRVTALATADALLVARSSLPVGITKNAAFVRALIVLGAEPAN